jgi:hypothetical protein
VPSISREPNDKAVRLSPSLGALGRDLKPQLNERGTALTQNLNIADKLWKLSWGGAGLPAKAL